MPKAKFIFYSLATSMLLVAGCQEDLDDTAKIGTPEEQIAELQDDYKEIIAETDSDYGKLVFYSLENEDAAGVGLALFDEEDGEWVYSDGTAHLISSDSETVAFPSDRIELNDETEIVYGYISESAIDEIQQVESEELVDGILPVSESNISYTFISPDQDIIVMPK